MTRSLILPLTLVAVVGVQGRAGSQDTTPTPVALLSRVQGDVRVQCPTGVRAVRLFERLHAGDILRTGETGEAVVVFRNGTRTRVLAASAARIDAGRATRVAGSIELLPTVPAVPLVAPVAGAGTTVTAVRIRAGEIRIVEPLPDAMTLANHTRLVFDTVESAEYEIAVEDRDARVVFRSRERDTQVTVPAGVLRPGVVYRWRVDAHLPTGFEVHGEGRFQTLPAAEEHSRAELRAALAGVDPDSLALLAEVDWTLGLWSEANGGFLAAQQAGATDPTIDARLAEIARRQAGGSPAHRGNAHR